MFQGSIVKPGFNPLATQTPTILYNLIAWGQNTGGQLGLGNLTNYSSPKQVGSAYWSTVANNYAYTLAIKTDGTLWSTGYNPDGQLGLGDKITRSDLTQVGALTNWSQVVCALYSALAIKTDGTLWAWGSGSQGQLGLGNTASYSSPKQVGALTSWSLVNSGCSGQAVGAIASV
jgi:alpha-tubulin suppressor-like RCC1 family protein